MKHLTLRNFYLFIIGLSFLMGLLGALKFEGYIRGISIIPVACTHLFLVYQAAKDPYARPERVHKGRRPQKRQEVKELYPNPNLDIDNFTDEELLQIEAELFEITVKNSPVPRVFTQQLKHVRELLRERGLERSHYI